MICIGLHKSQDHPRWPHLSVWSVLGTFSNMLGTSARTEPIRTAAGFEFEPIGQLHLRIGWQNGKSAFTAARSTIGSNRSESWPALFPLDGTLNLCWFSAGHKWHALAVNKSTITARNCPARTIERGLANRQNSGHLARQQGRLVSISSK